MVGGAGGRDLRAQAANRGSRGQGGLLRLAYRRAPGHPALARPSGPGPRLRPPLWFPSGERNSIDFTARHGYHTVLRGSVAEAGKLNDQYREVWGRHGDDPGRHNAHVRAPKLGKSQHVFVAETEADAAKTGLPAFKVWAEHIVHLTRKHGRPDLLQVDPTAPQCPH